MIKALSNTSVDLYVNGRWVMDFLVLDDDGNVVTNAAVSVVVTTPSSTTVVVPVVKAGGYYRATYTTADDGGRFLAAIEASGYGSASFVAYVEASEFALPGLADVKAYLANAATGQFDSTADSQVQDALDTEMAAQRRMCNVPAAYPPDLRQALYRRVAVNLAKRELPIMVLQSATDSGSLVPPGRDPEVRRLEAPFRKLVQP